MKKVIKKHYKIIIGVIIGLIISVPVVYAAQIVLSGNEVSYNNETSGGSSSTVQGAIDELYDKVNKSKVPKASNTNIVAVYYYNQEQGSDNFCVTGDEKTCKYDTCYLNETKDSCPPGTIIEYKVNDSDTIRFHVVHDDGKTMTLQNQKNIGYNILFDSTNGIDKGVNNILNIVEEKTSGWSNVNIFNYSIGEENSTLGYSVCDPSICNSSLYKLEKSNVKARMITVQEAKSLGCKFGEYEKTCPIWLYNYLYNSITYGGTINDPSADYGYFTMSMRTNTNLLYHIRANGVIDTWNNLNNKQNEFGIRAVVEINK